MTAITRLLPDAATAAGLPPEVAASFLLEYLNLQADADDASRGQRSRAMAAQPKPFHVGSVMRELVQHYRVDWYSPVSMVFAEAWVWLEQQTLLIPQPTGDAGWAVLSRRGRECRTPDALRRVAAMRLLRLETLHPTVAECVGTSFAAGEYDIAVLKAFRAVEVEMRARVPSIETNSARDLVRKALRKDGGPLVHPEHDAGTQDAVADLFAGAMGYFRNAASHKRVVYDNPAEAAEAIGLASLLLRVLDRAPSAPPP